MARIVDGPQITGRVVNRQTGAPYGGVTVTASPAVYTDREMTASTTTLTADGTGNFSCYALPGTYTFTTAAVNAAAIEPVEVLGKEGTGADRALSGASVPAPTAPDANKVVTVKSDGSGYELDATVSLAQAGQDPSPLGTAARGTGTAAARYDHVHPGGGIFGWLGAGADGSATFDGSATPTGTTKVDSTHYKANRDLFYTSMTISNGVTLDLGGNQLYVAGTLAGPGSGGSTITAVPTAVSGTNQADALFGRAVNGGDPCFISLGTGTPGANGSTGAGSTPSFVASTTSNAGNGHGGTGSGGAGGGSVSTPNTYAANSSTSMWRRWDVTTSGRFHAFDAHSANWSDLGKTAAIIVFGGTGGSSGGGDGTNKGGAGGTGGNIVIVNAKTVTGIVNVTAPGGAGGTPTTGNCGGGGGGAGGVAILNAGDLTGWTGAISAAGGVHGNGVGSGTVGTDGTAGVALATQWS